MWGNSELKLEIKKLKNELYNYKTEVDRLKELIKNGNTRELSLAKFEVDFERLNAVSIERYRDEDQTYSIIGYYNRQNIINEWNFYCSFEEHQRLAEEFVQYKNTKSSTGLVGTTSIATNGSILSPNPLLSK